MLLGNFEFIPYIQGMFDGKEQGAVFLFKHVKSNNHYACRYWDASRFAGSDSYPLSLTNFLRHVPSEIEVFVLPLINRSRKSGEQVMNKVVDYLTEHKLYRGTASRVRGGTNVLEPETFRLALFKHKRTGAMYFTGIASASTPEKHLVAKAIEFNGLALRNEIRPDAIHVFTEIHGPTFSPECWDTELIDSSSVQHHHLMQRIEEVSIAALRAGKFVINRIRTHSPLWYFNNLYRGKNITVEQYVELGRVGDLAKNRQLQSPSKA